MRPLCRPLIVGRLRLKHSKAMERLGRNDVKLKCLMIGLVFSGIALGQVAVAHDDSVKAKPMHGGQLVEDAASHTGIEMVASASALTFHVTEHLKPLDVTGGAFKAIVQTDDGMKMHSLVTEGSVLTAKLNVPLPTGARIAFTGKDKDGQVFQARFVMP